MESVYIRWRRMSFIEEVHDVEITQRICLDKLSKEYMCQLTSEDRVKRHEIRRDGQRDHGECECQELIYHRSVPIAKD